MGSVIRWEVYRAKPSWVLLALGGRAEPPEPGAWGRRPYGTWALRPDPLVGMRKERMQGVAGWQAVTSGSCSGRWGHGRVPSVGRAQSDSLGWEGEASGPTPKAADSEPLEAGGAVGGAGLMGPPASDSGASLWPLHSQPGVTWDAPR